jgi:hypothetical protein
MKTTELQCSHMQAGACDPCKYPMRAKKIPGVGTSGPCNNPKCRERIAAKKLRSKI